MTDIHKYNADKIIKVIISKRRTSTNFVWSEDKRILFGLIRVRKAGFYDPWGHNWEAYGDKSLSKIEGKKIIVHARVRAIFIGDYSFARVFDTDQAAEEFALKINPNLIDYINLKNE